MLEYEIHMILGGWFRVSYYWVLLTSRGVYSLDDLAILSSISFLGKNIIGKLYFIVFSPLWGYFRAKRLLSYVIVFVQSSILTQI